MTVRSFTKSAILSHFKIGCFVTFSKSAVLSHLKSAVLSCPPKIGIFFFSHTIQSKIFNVIFIIMEYFLAIFINQRFFEYVKKQEMFFHLKFMFGISFEWLSDKYFICQNKLFKEVENRVRKFRKHWLFKWKFIFFQKNCGNEEWDLF